VISRASSPRELDLVEIDGETHTVEVWLRRKGISFKAYRARLESGMSPEEALSKPLAKDGQPGTLVTIDGMTKNIGAWCKHFGISRGMVEQRRKDGMTLAQALSTPKSDQRRGIEKRMTLVELRAVIEEQGDRIARLERALSKYMGYRPPPKEPEPPGGRCPMQRRGEDAHGRAVVCVGTRWYCRECAERMR